MVSTSRQRGATDQRPRPDRRPEPAAPDALPGIIDAHAHTWSREFERDRDAVMDRAWAAGLAAVVDVGVDTESSARCRAEAQADPRVHAVAGLHPHDAKHLARERAGLEGLVAGGGFVAVGETGLDLYRNLSPPEAQHEAFRWQLDLAREHDLPVVIHSRDADAETFEVLEDWAGRVGRYLGPEREIGMMHCFAGDVELARRYLDLGFLISIPGTVTYPGNARGRDVACTIPLAGMLVETDCPYLAPVPHRGRRNEPALVVTTARFIAAARGCAAEEVAEATARNAARLFGLEGPGETQ